MGLHFTQLYAKQLFEGSSVIYTKHRFPRETLGPILLSSLE